MKSKEAYYLWAIIYAFLTAIAVCAAIGKHPTFFAAATLWGLLYIANLFRYAVFAIKDK